MTLSDRWLIHRHIARQTDERLAIVTRTPQHILLVGADADESRSLLAARYPKAAFSEYDPRADFLQAAAAGRKSGLLAKLAGKTVAQHRQALETPLPLPAYERILKAAHSFNLLDARKAISVTERQRYILRIRTLTKAVAEAYYASREALGFPMLKQDSAE